MDGGVFSLLSVFFFTNADKTHFFTTSLFYAGRETFSDSAA